MAKATTRIGTPTSDTSRFRMRGKDVLTEILGKHSFSETFYFIVTGDMPTEGQRQVLDAAMIILMDHGVTPNALVARLVADSVPDDIQVPLAAGMLMVGRKFVGTMVGAGEIFNEGVAAGGDKHAWAATKVAEFRAQKRYIPGFGHPYYNPEDPRAARMFEIARDAGMKGDYIEFAHIMGEEIDRAAGRHLTMNVTGALGAVLNEIGFPVSVMRSVAAIGRTAGLVAHIHEEQTSPAVPAVVDFINTEIEYRDPE